MGVFFFYNNRRPRRFNYKPVLYDPDEDRLKEHVQNRIRAVKKEMGLELEEAKLEPKDFKSEFVSQTKHLKKRHQRVNSGQNSFLTNNPLLIVVAVLLIALFLYWIIG